LVEATLIKTCTGAIDIDKVGKIVYSGFQAGVAQGYIPYISLNWRGSQIQKGAKKSERIKRKDETRALFH
jgi:hypothetical protein